MNNCTCNTAHKPGDLDEFGNVLLWTSASDPSNKKFLTLPGDDGIAVNDVTVSVVGKNVLKINILNGAGIGDIHSARVTITDSEGAVKANLTFSKIVWTQSGSTYSVQSTSNTQIGSMANGNYKATINFYTNENASGTQAATISGINFTK